jgi:uncharacterized membrane protein
MYEFDLIYINIWERDISDASSFSIMFKNISSMAGFFDGYGKWVFLTFGVIGIILIVLCVSCCYVKAKKDRTEMIKKHIDNSQISASGYG